MRSTKRRRRRRNQATQAEALKAFLDFGDPDPTPVSLPRRELPPLETVSVAVLKGGRPPKVLRRRKKRRGERSPEGFFGLGEIPEGTCFQFREEMELGPGAPVYRLLRRGRALVPITHRGRPATAIVPSFELEDAELDLSDCPARPNETIRVVRPNAPRSRDYQRALRTYRRFHGVSPQAMTRIPGARARGEPRYWVGIGRALEVAYSPWAHSARKPRPPFLHTFGKRVILATDPTGRTHRFIDPTGKLRFDPDRGIVG